MFQSYEFTFAGIAASEYGLFLCDTSNGKHSDTEFGTRAKPVRNDIKLALVVV